MPHWPPRTLALQVRREDMMDLLFGLLGRSGEEMMLFDRMEVKVRIVLQIVAREAAPLSSDLDLPIKWKTGRVMSWYQIGLTTSH